MQGPYDPQPGRRAGDSSRMSASPQQELKDWQRNATWVGPVPVNPDPFDEPENSPELEDERSKNVREHAGEFWDEIPMQGYETRSIPVLQQGKTAQRAEGKRERRISLRNVGIIAGVLVSILLILYFSVFRIREIRVIGNEDISTADVIRFSGIRRGGSILRLSERETEEQLNNSAVSAAVATGNYNYYRLQFRYLEKEMPGTVILAVKEREACCWLSWCGINYVLDKTGLVLYETEDPEKMNQVNLVEVKGLEIRSGARVGQRMVLSSALQESIFNDLFLEMKVVGCTEEIREVDLSNTASILMTTRKNFNVAMGTRDSLHAKLKSIMLVQSQLLAMGKTEGSINVSNPEVPIYSPSAPQ